MLALEILQQTGAVSLLTSMRSPKFQQFNDTAALFGELHPKEQRMYPGVIQPKNSYRYLADCMAKHRGLQQVMYCFSQNGDSTRKQSGRSGREQINHDRIRRFLQTLIRFTHRFGGCGRLC